MSYVPSSQIKVFPLAKNRADDTGSRLLYESNIANIIRQLITNDGFVIKPKYEPPDEQYTEMPYKLDSNTIKITGDVIFNLGGYYFEILGSSSEVIVGSVSASVDAGKNVYAGIKIQDNEIRGQDVDTNYEGLALYIAESKDSDNYDYSLGLCMYDGSKLIKISDSYQKFSLTDLNITGIDGKHD